MKYFIAFILIATTSIAYSGIAGFLTREAQDWKFVQSVGGMKISQEGKTLVVDCDVSGLKEVTVKPTMINSGMGVRQLKQKLAGETIQLTLVTSVIEKGITTSCSPLDLSAYPPGEYLVQYLDPDGTTHDLGDIVLEDDESGDPE